MLGIANTLALSVVERTREIGLLRAIGMTRSQVRTMVRWESVIIALYGTALGLTIGIVFGWAVFSALADDGITTLAIPVPSLAVAAVPRRRRRPSPPAPAPHSSRHVEPHASTPSQRSAPDELTRHHPGCWPIER